MSLKTSCIIHPKSHPFIRIMRWQIEACDENVCAAALLSMFEAWHNWKIEQSVKAGKLNDISQLHGFARSQDESFYQWHNEDDLVKGILSIYGRVTVGKAIKLLIKKEFVSVHRNPDTRAKFDRTRFFLFEVAAVQIWINQNYPATIALDEASATFGGWSAKSGAPSAKSGSASANSGALSANSGGSYKESTETDLRNRPKKQQQHTAEAENAAVVVVNSNLSVEEKADPLSQTNLLREMHAIGVSPEVATQFISDPEITPELLRLQLDCLRDREPKKPAAVFVSAVRGKWSPPGEYHTRLEAAEGIKIARAAKEQRDAAESRQRAAMDAEAAQSMAGAARLDDIWQKLDGEDRALVESTGLKLASDSIMDQVGNSESAILRRRIECGDGLPPIERRAAIEHLLDEGLLIADDIEEDAAAPVTPPAAPRAATPPGSLSSPQLDQIWAELPSNARKPIEIEIENRLESMPATLRTDELRAGLRRALLTDFIARATAEASGDATNETAKPQTKIA